MVQQKRGDATPSATRRRSVRRRGWAPDSPRSRQVSVYFSTGEWADVQAHAAVQEVSPAALIAGVSVDYVRAQLRPVPAGWQDLTAELLRWRSQAVRLIDQQTRPREVEGALREDSERLLALLERLLTRVDQATEWTARQQGRARR
jgi:hypothetical protein